MKKKLLVLVATLLCVVTVLSACTSSMKFEKIASDGAFTDENPTLTTATKLEVTGTVDQSKGDLVVFENTNSEGKTVTTVYNLATGTTLWTATNSETTTDTTKVTVSYTVGLMEQMDTVWYAVATTTTTTTVVDSKSTTTTAVALYDIKGTQFATSTNENAQKPEQVLDMIRYEGKVYRIAEDGAITEAFEMSDLRAMPDVTQKLGDYYYDFSDSYDGPVAVYDANLNLVAYYALPSYTDDDIVNCCVLNNGNVLVQYQIYEGEFTEDYTYVVDGKKYTLCSYLLDVESGKLKELDLDFVVRAVLARDVVTVYFANDIWEACGLNAELENVAVVNYIENERLNTEASAMKLVAMSNKGKIEGEINLIENQTSDPIMLIAEKRWVVENLVGQSFLLNEKGEVIGEVTGMDYDEMTANFFVLNNKIYDWDLNVKCDLNEQKIEGSYTIMNHSVLFETEDGETKLYVNGEVKTIMDKATAEAGKRQYVPLSAALYVIIDTATEGTTKYEVYNDIGTLLTTVDNADFDTSCIVCTADSNNAVLIVGLDKDLKPVYYRVG